MTKRFLEITAATKNRVGFYNELPPGTTEYTVGAWHVKEGDIIPGREDPNTGSVAGGLIVSVSAEKGATEIDAVGEEIGARVVKILVPEGASVSIDLRKEPLRLAEIEIPGAAASALPPQPVEETAQPSCVKAAPRTRQIAKEKGLDIWRVAGSGPGGIVRECDIADAAPVRAEERGYTPLPLTALARATAEEMRKAQLMPLAGETVEADAGELLALLSEMRPLVQTKRGLKLRLEHFFAAACAELLKEPEFRILNACWHEEGGVKEIRLYDHLRLGIAVSIPAEHAGGICSGLATPSVKDAHTRSFFDLALEIERLIAAGLNGKFAMADVMPPTFLLNNVGAPVSWRGTAYQGGEDPHPLLVTSTGCGIAFGAIRDKRMRIAIRFDHRVMNGREPITFLRVLQHEYLAHPLRLFS